MKRIFFVIIALCLFASHAWGAAATVTETSYGYVATGGVELTNVVSDTWVTATAYTVGQQVVYSGIIYTCQVAHTSGTFATDLTSAYWVTGPYATIWVTAITQYASTATDVVMFRSGSTAASCVAILNTNSLPLDTVNGTQFQNLKIQLKAATDIVCIFVKRRNF
jgi:hypothetical protein